MAWFSEAWATLSDALGVRKYVVLGTSGAAAAVLSAAVGRLLDVTPGTGSGLLFHGLFFLLALAIILLIITLNEATKLRIAAKPKFAVSFDPEKSGIVWAIDKNPFAGTSTYLVGGEQPKYGSAYYVRIQVTALSNTPVRECHAFITALEKRDDSDSPFLHIILPNPQSLREQTFDVLPNIPCFVDFMKANEVDNKLRRISYWPHALEGVFDDYATYRFTITVNGDGVTAKPIYVEIDWEGEWDKISARQVSLPK